MSRVMRKPVYAICEQQRRISSCASAQSDHHLFIKPPRPRPDGGIEHLGYPYVRKAPNQQEGI